MIELDLLLLDFFFRRDIRYPKASSRHRNVMAKEILLWLTGRNKSLVITVYVTYLTSILGLTDSAYPIQDFGGKIGRLHCVVYCKRQI